MAFSRLETSDQDGRPLILYQFELGNKVWRYTSADSSVSANGALYESVFIEDEGVNQTGEAQSDTFKLRMPFATPVPQLFQVTPPINQIAVKRFALHDGDTEAILNYVGFITQVNASEPGMAEIECITLSPTMQRNGLRLTWSRGCPYSVYDPSTCKANKAAYAVTALIKTAGAGILTTDAVKAFSDGYFDGGFIEWTDSFTGAQERRGVDAHAGDQLRLLGKSDGILEGMSIKVYPGCPRTTQACQDKFNNLLNYGGVPHMPGKSPFGQDPLY
ncbi:tail assembly protein [Serratia phage JS26]|uniref:Bacteriophage phiJL001 Gp84 C-terminal domain-containing protein n=1 Tax=Serratia phage JS26 TaxID=2315217 RepID=A0A5Q2F2P1_9CAUD|nr:tail assembly protein [Serratia phage JS26]QGF20883.1 hypothetical protein [Serratia phage JS26]